MAENANDNTSSSNEGSPLKAILVVLAVLLLEGGTIGVTMYLAGGPKAAQAKQLSSDSQAKANETVELKVVDDRFPNTRTGKQFLYDTEVYVATKQKHRDTVKEALKSKKARISMAIGTIIRKADPSYFKEPTLATLRRQMKATLDEKIGTAPSGESYIRKVLITRCTPFRADF